ncbi:hypothetical protein A8D80_08675 [Burkholderia cenocepacia]|nr:hypothetical protein A8D80_08675 [Burkholderia cenocepacia]ONT38261.1 hypothetical protein A8E47_29770 [Burkholderia cenocepacia]ONW95903.1 hypothetical protein A8F04_31350 [Burkholderia cenocepacia]OOA74662.1 hypothetical protein A8F59_31210 [Burkholderia cenocepacia]OOB20159.1 hypothetical protein A8F68_36585 [Burkholderia cenocepacia]
MNGACDRSSALITLFAASGCAAFITATPGMLTNDECSSHVTHEVRFAQDVADRVVFMENGVVVQDTTPDAFFTASTHPRVRQFLNLIET